MRTGKIAFIIVLALSLSSCGQVVRREVLDASEQENQELRESLKEVQENYIKQNKELNDILTELSEINYQTVSLQLDVEHGSASRSQADKISDNIQSLKARIDQLEQDAQRARKVDKDLAIAVSTIKTLRTTISNQEKEIELLKQTVTDQNNTIKKQNDTIETQKDSIRIQNDNLRKQNELINSQHDQLKETVKRQTQLLFEAGLELENIADEGDFSIKGKRNRTSISEYRKMIYDKAIMFYQAASNQGHPDAVNKIAGVKAKMALI